MIHVINESNLLMIVEFQKYLIYENLSHCDLRLPIEVL